MKLGRKKRSYNMAIPHMSALMAGRSDLITPPLSADYTAKLPADTGVMLNDRLGDCTCAAYYHARQLWSATAQGKEITNPDSDVLALYEKACGYNPGDSNTDQGGCEQDVLTYLLNNGAPGCDPILAFVEIDPRNLDDLKRAIYENGCVYVGVDLPQSILAGDAPPPLWSAIEGDSIAGGHAIILTGYTLDTFSLISWGKEYLCTHGFISQYCEEAYAIADREWINATGMTPLGLSVQELETMMKVLKNAA